MTGFDEATRSEIATRANGRCEARCAPNCAQTGSWCHHRLLRRHGDHTAVNGLFVCTPCHDRIHKVGSAAYEAGFLVHAWEKPGDVRVVPGLFVRGL